MRFQLPFLNKTQLTFIYDQWLEGNLLFEGNSLTQGVITNMDSLSLKEDEGIYISMQLDEIDADNWIEYIVHAQQLNATNPYQVSHSSTQALKPYQQSVDERIRFVEIFKHAVLGGSSLRMLTLSFIKMMRAGLSTM